MHACLKLIRYILKKINSKITGEISQIKIYNPNLTNKYHTA